MQVYRISKHKYSEDLSGTGAGIGGGRWNLKDFKVVYTSSSRALATLEVLVHISAGIMPASMALTVLYIPDDSISFLDEALLKEGWDSIVQADYLKSIGTAWLMQGKTLTFRAPSAVVKGEYNFLLNPAHSRMKEVKILTMDSYKFDERLFIKN